jgi:hypothetical protein
LSLASATCQHKDWLTDRLFIPELYIETGFSGQAFLRVKFQAEMQNRVKRQIRESLTGFYRKKVPRRNPVLLENLSQELFLIFSDFLVEIRP